MELLTPDVGLFFWSALVFLVLLFLLSKFAWGPIMAGLREREQAIEDALSKAEKAKADLANLTAKNEQLLQEARAKKEEILRDAQKQAVEMVENARAEAATRAAADLEAARVAIQTERAAAMAEIKNFVADLSITIAERVVQKQLASEASQQELVKQMLGEYGVN